MEKILIAITTAENVYHETMESIYNLIIPEGVSTELKIVHSYNVADGRNKLVDYMFETKADYIFFVDSDVVLPKNALVDLYNMKWYFSTGTYLRKEKRSITDPDPYTTLYLHNEDNKTKYSPVFMRRSFLQEGIIIPVDCCGLGCTLVSREVFVRLNQKGLPYFFFAHEGDPKTGEYCIGEDMYFCRNVLQQLDIQPWAHGSVICKHIGKYFY